MSIEEMKLKDILQLISVLKSNEEIDKKYVGYKIVRTYSAGVFAGEIVSRKGREIIMRNARRLYYWDGASTLSQLAMEGTKKPENCKFPCEVEKVELLEVIEILDVTTQAEKSIKGVAIWEQ